MNMKTVFFAEDEPLARDVLRDAIYAHPGLRLVGEAADGASALAHITRLRPDVVFMDIQMPEMTGLEYCAGSTTCRKSSSPRPTTSTRSRPSNCTRWTTC